MSGGPPAIRPRDGDDPLRRSLVRATLATGSIRPVYQPIVRLDDGAVVAFEALSRGPRGSAVERPESLFAAARAVGLLADLDRLCRTVALRGALDGGLLPPLALFLNTEPATVGQTSPDPRSNGSALDVVVEFAERVLVERPADVLRAASLVRAEGWGVALDNVGRDPRGLALLPLLRPQVIKLDLHALRERGPEASAMVAAAVNAHAERFGAVLLVQGIENPAELADARAMGATLGQGRFFGGAGPLPSGVRRLAGEPLSLPRWDATIPHATPFDVVAEARPVRAADGEVVADMVRLLQEQAAATGSALLGVVGSAGRFREQARRWTAVSERTAYTAVFGSGLGAGPALRVHGVDLALGDPLADEQDVVVLGETLSAALVSRPRRVALGAGDHDLALTYDPHLVAIAATPLLSRLAP
jgi:EAL domain-containing protein (putative c-di-GMP-specific phosphodiesterase class I)